MTTYRKKLEQIEPSYFQSVFWGVFYPRDLNLRHDLREQSQQDNRSENEKKYSKIRIFKE